jgi:hypothetical protein
MVTRRLHPFNHRRVNWFFFRPVWVPDTIHFSLVYSKVFSGTEDFQTNKTLRAAMLFDVMFAGYYQLLS